MQEPAQTDSASSATSQDSDSGVSRLATSSELDDEARCLDELAVREADVEVPPQTVVKRGGTFESFRHRDYTLFWTGALVSNTGTWMQNYALAIVVYSFRRSEFDLGLVNFLSGLPILVLAMAAGTIADKVDKRRLLIVSQGVLLLQAAALGILFLTGHLSSERPVFSLLAVALLGLLGGVMSALTFPAWQSLLPDLVPRDALLNAIALNSAQFQTSRLFGPLVASALVLAGASMGDIFLVNAASFLFVIAALWAIRPHPESATAGAVAHGRPTTPPAQGAGQSPGAATRERSWRAMTAGFRYAVEHRVVGVLILSTAVMTIFGMPYMMLLPAIADKTLHQGSLAVSYLMSANGLGAVVGALIVASLPKSTDRERLIPGSLIAMGLFILGFSLSRALWLSLVLSALAGASVLTVNSLTNTAIQAAAPHHLRGRIMALFIMAFMGLMPISSIVFGAIGEAVGPSTAVTGGAVVLVLWAGTLVLRPSLLREETESAAA